MSPTSTQTSKSAQDFIPIQEIRDGIVILKDGGLRVVMLASSINFALKSPDEQIAIITQYQNFLNSLDFPIQIVLQSRRLDIRPYLAVLESQLKDQTNDLIKLQTREYIEFIKNFTEATDIMTKSFFVVVPYDVSAIAAPGFLGKLFGKSAKTTLAEDKLQEIQERKTQVEQRASVVQQGLVQLGVRVAQLGTEELVELYYKSFNPGENDVPSSSGLSQAMQK